MFELVNLTFISLIACKIMIYSMNILKVKLKQCPLVAGSSIAHRSHLDVYYAEVDIRLFSLILGTTTTVM